MKLIAYGYIPNYHMFSQEVIVTDDFYVDKYGNFEAIFGGNCITSDSFNIANVYKRPGILKDVELKITEIKLKEEFDFKLPTWKSCTKTIKDFKIGDFVTCNSGHSGKIVNIISPNTVIFDVTEGSKKEYVHNLIEKCESVYEQYKNKK